MLLSLVMASSLPNEDLYGAANLKYMCWREEGAGGHRVRLRNRIGWVAVTLLVLAALPAIANGQRVKVWVSSNRGDRLAAKEDLEFRKVKAAATSKADFSID
ncbi:MAG TPA: hypothetical protein VHP80_14490, partial [Candidatus Acidoferrum sp.]|nr:hypothetical protein [Candidatus Acidoferrum sp.]